VVIELIMSWPSWAWLVVIVQYITFKTIYTVYTYIHPGVKYIYIYICKHILLLLLYSIHDAPGRTNLMYTRAVASLHVIVIIIYQLVCPRATTDFRTPFGLTPRGVYCSAYRYIIIIALPCNKPTWTRSWADKLHVFLTRLN